MKITRKMLRRILQERAIETKEDMLDELYVIMTLYGLGYEPENGSDEEDKWYDVAERVLNFITTEYNKIDKGSSNALRTRYK